MLRRLLRVITILHTRSTGINSDFFGDFLRMLLDPGEPGFCRFCWVFKGCFGKRGSLNVVILWFPCGGMCGKRGHRDDSF